MERKTRDELERDAATLARIRKNQKKQNDNYNRNTVDRLSFTVPKGRKADIVATAAARGLSVNAYLSSVVMADIDKPS